MDNTTDQQRALPAADLFGLGARFRREVLEKAGIKWAEVAKHDPQEMAVFCFLVGAGLTWDDARMAENLDLGDETTCSRIADPEGKHLEICRIQLARTVKQRDELAAMIERFAEDVDGQGDEIWAKQLRLHVREILTENDPVEARDKQP